jgi:signal transduction histidine kinase
MLLNLSKRRCVGFLGAWAVIGLLFAILYSHERLALVGEVRSHAQGIAAAVAAGVNASDIEAVKTPEDAGSESFRRVQAVLDNLAATEPAVTYIYTMRRSAAPGAKETDYEYVVDQAPRDRDRDGELDPDEDYEAIGNPYDASEYPRLVEAWMHPSADDELSPDPPYGVLLSGYAPIKTAEGKTVGIVGVDISAKTISDKLFQTRVVIIYVAVLMCTLVALAVQLVYQQHESISMNQALRDALDEKYQELQRVLQLREELSRMIAHDMRNHLTVIEMGCQILEDQKQLDPDNGELIEQMNLEAQRLNAFINDLLMLAKMEDGKLILKRGDVDLRKLIEETRDRSTYVARSRKVRLQTQIPDAMRPLEADASLLQRVIDNLVNNALKFSPPETTVTISVAQQGDPGAADTHGHRIRIDVADEGPGIEPKYRERIFDRFNIVDVKKNVPQIGLGLAFCKMVVEAHHGRIFVNSNASRGSVFTVEI